MGYFRKNKFSEELSILAIPIPEGILGVDFASYLIKLIRGDPNDCNGCK
jgi:hypothetical protein